MNTFFRVFTLAGLFASSSVAAESPKLQLVKFDVSLDFAAKTIGMSVSDLRSVCDTTIKTGDAALVAALSPSQTAALTASFKKQAQSADMQKQDFTASVVPDSADPEHFYVKIHVGSPEKGDFTLDTRDCGGTVFVSKDPISGGTQFYLLRSE